MPKFVMLSISCLLLATISHSQIPNWGNYNVHSNKVLATSGSFQYTEGHFQKGLRFVEFILNEKITETEKQAGLQESLKVFQLNPQASIDETESIDAQMQQVYQLNDPVKIALFRSAMLSYLSTVFAQTGQNPVVRQLIDKYNPVLVYDSQNQLAFTQKDFEGYMGVAALQAEIAGQSFQLDPAVKEQYKQHFIQVFTQGDLETRQTLCLMEVTHEYLRNAYKKMNEQQKQQMQVAVLDQYTMTKAPQAPRKAMPNDFSGMPDYSRSDNLWPPHIKTKEQKQAYLTQKKAEIASFNVGMNMMNNMMLEQHATMLNVIENIGGTNNYWEVKYNDY